MQSGKMTAPFLFEDGSFVTDLNGLLHKLQSMDDGSFSKHVGPNKHDFSNWVVNSLRNEQLGSFLQNVHDRNSMIAVIHNYILGQDRFHSTVEDGHINMSYPKDDYFRPGKPPVQKIRDPYIDHTHAQEDKNLARMGHVDSLPKHQVGAQKHITSAPPAQSYRPELVSEQSYPSNVSEMQADKISPHGDDMPEESIFAHESPANLYGDQQTTQSDPSHPHASFKPELSPEDLVEPRPTAPPVQSYQPQPTAPPVQPVVEQPPAQPTAPPVQPTAEQPSPEQTEVKPTAPGVPDEGEYQEQSIFSHESDGSKKQELQVPTIKRKVRIGNLIIDEDIVPEEYCRMYAQKVKDLRAEVGKIFIGQDDVVLKVILSLMCDAHTLMEGVPGLAKSLLVEVLAKTISDTKFKRIQFLPDMLPADVVGGQIYNPKSNEFITVKGPIFANFVLADEINRAPPKTHAAIMEAMAEKKINIDKNEYILERPFLVLATQNPLENKGTYELPEAVLDRFMFKVDLLYPSRADELRIITENATTKSSYKSVPNAVMSKQEFRVMQKQVQNVHISDKIRGYILDIVEATRGLNKNIEGIKFVKYGAGVRASIFLGIAAKAQAMTQGRNYVLPEDINAISKAVLRHRVLPNFKGKAYNISSDKIVDEILSKVTVL